MIGDAGDFEEQFRATFGRPVHRAERAPARVQKEIESRLWGAGGKSNKVEVELDQLPDFERQVLLKVLEIPRGEVRPYAWVAAELGTAARGSGRWQCRRTKPDPLRHPLPPGRPLGRPHRQLRRRRPDGQARGPGLRRRERRRARDGCRTAACASSAPIRRASSATRRAATPSGSPTRIGSRCAHPTMPERPATAHARCAAPSTRRSAPPSPNHD